MSPFMNASNSLQIPKKTHEDSHYVTRNGRLERYVRFERLDR